MGLFKPHVRYRSGNGKTDIKKKSPRRGIFFVRIVYISGAIAQTGQIDAHVPHEMHFDGSITHLPSASTDIAATGHMPMHV